MDRDDEETVMHMPRIVTSGDGGGPMGGHAAMRSPAEPDAARLAEIRARVGVDAEPRLALLDRAYLLTQLDAMRERLAVLDWTDAQRAKACAERETAKRERDEARAQLASLIEAAQATIDAGVLEEHTSACSDHLGTGECDCGFDAQDLLIRAVHDLAPTAKARDERLVAEAIEKARGFDTETRVRFYEHDFYPLSNFSAFPIRWPTDDYGGAYDEPFLTSEHVYHWEKFRFGTGDANDIARRIRTGHLSAHDAFKLAEANKAHRHPDWDNAKVDVMRRILRAKVQQHEYVRRKLLATGDRELVEDSWRDDFWGWGPNRDGQNMLGKLWMELRAELRGAR